MALAATSIKIPRPLKAKIERLARKTGQTSHAFMLRALEGLMTKTSSAPYVHAEHSWELCARRTLAVIGSAYENR